MADQKLAFLCGAPQSSGSSLISWCFLQRGDTDGVLDARNDLLEEMPPISTPYAWCVENAEQTLRDTCEQLGLAWDPAMLTWPKAREQIAAPGHGSKTFRSSRGGSLAETLQAEFSTLETSNIPLEDLRWMESEF